MQAVQLVVEPEQTVHALSQGAHKMVFAAATTVVPVGHEHDPSELFVAL